jgi:hypothetical protein
MVENMIEKIGRSVDGFLFLTGIKIIVYDYLLFYINRTVVWYVMLLNMARERNSHFDFLVLPLHTKSTPAHFFAGERRNFHRLDVTS